MGRPSGGVIAVVAALATIPIAIAAKPYLTRSKPALPQSQLRPPIDAPAATEVVSATEPAPPPPPPAYEPPPPDTSWILSGTRVDGRFVPPPDPASLPDLADILVAVRCAEELLGGRWDALEALLREHRHGARWAGRSSPRLDDIVDALAQCESSVLRTRLDDWCRQRPGSAYARWVRGEFYVDFAWYVRGSGWARDVPKAAWHYFKERLRTARTELERASELDPGLAGPCASLITVSMGLDLGLDSERRWFEEAVRRDPRGVRAYACRLRALMPKWSGEPPELMWAFARESQRALPDEPALRILTLEAHLESARLASRRGTSPDREYLERAEVRKDFEAVHTAFLAAYPRERDACAIRMYVARKFLDDRAAERECLAHLALAGDRGAQVRLADLAEDPADRADWLWRAGVRLHGPAMLRFGQLVAAGEGVARDPVEGLRWVEKAARFDPDAYEVLADWYARGVGCAPDPAKAAELQAKAEKRQREKLLGAR